MRRTRSSRPWRVCLAVTAATIVGVSLARLVAQQPAPQSPSSQTPVFRGGVNFVSVDAFPRRDGKVIEGLTAADFQIFEDGKPQKVETFEFIRIEPNPVDSDRRDPSSQADADRQARDPKNRVFVIYLDLAHTTVSGSSYARQPIVDFLTRTIGRTDLFAYMTAEIPVGQITFGRRTETIESELVKYWPWGQQDRQPMPRTPAEQRLVECALVYEAKTGRDVEALLLGLYREDLLQTSLENLMVRLRDLRDERKNILFMSEGWVPRGPREELLNVSVSEGAVPQVGVGQGGRIGIGRSMQPFNTNYTDCDSQIRRLASIDFEKRFRDFLTTARRANVSFYPVDVGGLKVDSPINGPRSTLLTLAENTDGIAVTSTNDLQAGVRKISEDLSSFYLLGYYSTNQATDGRFRSIEVKVNQPRVQMSARRGYVAPTAAEVATGPPPAATPAGVDEALSRLAGLRDDIELFAYGAPSGAGLEVTAEVAGAALARGWQKGAAVEVTATNAGGVKTTASAAIAPGARGVRLTLPDADLAQGPWRIVARAAGPEGPVEARTEVAPVAAVLVGAPSAWRGTPSPRVPLKPLADFRLSRLERLRIEWPLIDDTATRVARLLDRKGQPLGAPLPFAALPPERRVAAVDLPLTAMPEGDFIVELTATRGDLTERRLFAFRVTR